MTFEDYLGEKKKLVAHSFALRQNALRYGTKWFQNCSETLGEMLHESLKLKSQVLLF